MQDNRGKEKEKIEIINNLPMDNDGQIALKSSETVHIILKLSRIQNPSSAQCPHTYQDSCCRGHSVRLLEVAIACT